MLILFFTFVFATNANAFTIISDFNNGGFEDGNFGFWISLVDTDAGGLISPDDFPDVSSLVQSANPIDGTFSAQFDLNYFGKVGNIGAGLWDLNGTVNGALYIPQDGDAITFKIQELIPNSPNRLRFLARVFTSTGVQRFMNSLGQCGIGAIPHTVLTPNDTSEQTITVNFDLETCDPTQALDVDFSKGFKIQFRTTSMLAADPRQAYSLTLDTVKLSRVVTVSLVQEFASATTILSDSNFTIRTKVTNDVNGLVVPDATVEIRINSSPFEAMNFDSTAQNYEKSFISPIVATDINVFIRATKSGFVPSNLEQNVKVRRPESQYLTVTLIENINRFEFNSVDFFPDDEGDRIIWRVDSNSIVSEVPLYKIFNSLTDGKQYFVFTSSDGNNFVFDDTLTFGSTTETPVQKIFDFEDEKYTYSFQDTLLPNETKFYLLEYRSPFRHFFTIRNSNEWQETLKPDVFDSNKILSDIYSISDKTNIRSIFIRQIPDVFEDESGAFEFQFTAHSDVNLTNIEVSRTILSGDPANDFTIGTVQLTTTPHRFSFTIDAFGNFDRQFLLKTSNSTSADIFITDYTIVARGFFTKRLKLFQADGSPLDVFLLSGSSKQFLQEGNPFRIDTEAYDREGVLDRLELEAFLDGTDENDKVKRTTFGIEGKEETFFTFDQLFPPIIDLNGSVDNPDPPRTLVVKAILFDENGVKVAIQSQTVTFLQFPFFPDDLIMNFFPTEKRLGKHPAGILDVSIKDANTLEAFDIRIFGGANTVDNPSFKTVIYRGQDFSCVGRSCRIQLTIDDFVFEDINANQITIFALLNTEFLNQDNNLTKVEKRLFITSIEFEIAKIYQVFERADEIYRADEEIGLVLILKDSEATNIRGKIEVFLTLQACTDQFPNGTCINQTTRYFPTSFIYDERFNVNYFFFKHLYFLDDGTQLPLLPDNNFIAFRATINDRTGVRTGITPVLVSRCLNKDFDSDFVDIFGNPFGLVAFLFSSLLGIQGCDDMPTDATQFDIITTTQNSDQERRMEIDVGHFVEKPSQTIFACEASDSNSNVIRNPLGQGIACFTLYEFAESPIDGFRIRVGNKFSDYSVEGKNRQYMEFFIPYEIVFINDVVLMKATLESQGSSITSVGEFIYEAFREIVAEGVTFGRFSLQDRARLITGEGYFKNFGADFDFTQAFSATTITGAFFYEFKEIPILNIRDFDDSKIADDLNRVDKKRFLEFLVANEIDFEKRLVINKRGGKLEVTFNDFTQNLTITDNDGILVIDQSPSKVQINRAFLDPSEEAGEFTEIPNDLKFTLSNTMFFNNFSQNDVLSLILALLIVLPETASSTISAVIGAFIDNPFSATTDFLLTNIFIIAILSGVIIIVSIARRNFASGGG